MTDQTIGNNTESCHKSNAVEKKHGKWSLFDDGDGFGFLCSACKTVTYGCSLEIAIGDFKYCPYCGARMVTDDV